MKNSKLIKIFLVMVVSICVVFVATNVFADDEGYVDLTNTVGNNTAEDNNESLDVGLDEDVNTTDNNALLDGITTTNNTNSNSSSYNTNVNTNTNLPSTGIADSGATIALIVVLAISGVYAYKKLRDYKNI